MKYLYILIISALFVSCSTFKEYQISGKAIVTKEAPVKYAYLGEGKIGDEIGKLDNKIGDTLRFVSILSNHSGSEYNMRFICKEGDQTYCIKFPDVHDLEDWEIDHMSQKVVVSKEEAEAAWSRAVRFVADNATMKIQTQTDLLIETYNPIDYKNDIGFIISRINLGKEVEIKVEQKGGQSALLGMAGWKHHPWQKCAYYIKTGRL